MFKCVLNNLKQQSFHTILSSLKMCSNYSKTGPYFSELGPPNRWGFWLKSSQFRDITLQILKNNSLSSHVCWSVCLSPWASLTSEFLTPLLSLLVSYSLTVKVVETWMFYGRISGLSWVTGQGRKLWTEDANYPHKVIQSSTWLT